MRLLPKLTLGILVAATLPLAIAGGFGMRDSARELRLRIRADQAALATGAAASVGRYWREQLGVLAVLPDLVELEGSPETVVMGALRIAYRSGEGWTQVALLDPSRRLVVPIVAATDPQSASLLGGRPIVSAEAQAEFLARIPIDAAQRDGSAIGRRVGDRVAIAVADGDRLIAAEVGIEALERELAQLSRGGSQVALVDDTVAGEADGFLTTVAAVAHTPFAVRVTQPESLAFAPVADFRRRMLFWLGIAGILAVIAGVALTRGVTDRVAALARGTASLARGDRETRLPEHGADELADLARDWNRMATELERWNRELETRVADKSRELEAARELLARSRALAALGTMGAGVAHEINNPLTAILGAAQILLTDLPDGAPHRPLLLDVERQAQRIRRIVAELLEMTERESGHTRTTVALPRLVDDAVALVGEDHLGEAGIVLERAYAEVPEVRADADLLRAALVELLTNARRAMPRGGRLSLRTTASDRRLVVLEIADSGHGIPPELVGRIFDPFFTTKSEWGAPGLGLTRVHRIIEAHHGTIAVASPPGRGTTFTITLPADGARSAVT